VNRLSGRSLLTTAPVWLPAIVCTAQERPSLAGAINDFANVLSAETEASLSALVESIEQGTTAENRGRDHLARRHHG
jgi:hypothetical protein